MSAEEIGFVAETPSSARARQVLVAEDDAEMRRLLASALRKDGYEVVEASDGVECFGCMYRWVLCDDPVPPADLIISDIRMPGWTGLAILQFTRCKQPTVPVILMTAFSTAQTCAEAHRLGAAAVFGKPFDVDDLRTVVGSLLPTGPTSAAQE